MNEIEKTIGSLIMCQELMLFDPMTGETHELWQENKDNQDLYNACSVAIQALQEKQKRKKGCPQCDPKNIDFYYGGNVPNYCKNCGRKLGAKK